MDKMRESCFAVLGDMSGKSFLDLFSGSGIIALEAVSRGAKHAVLCEKDKLKIKTLLPKTERDSGSKNIINRLVEEANETARDYVMQSTKNIVTIGKIIKSLIDDQSKSKPELITNWKELDKYSETPLKDAGIGLYKKIYLFTNLIKTCLNQSE